MARVHIYLAVKSDGGRIGGEFMPDNRVAVCHGKMVFRATEWWENYNYHTCNVQNRTLRVAKANILKKL